MNSEFEENTCIILSNVILMFLVFKFIVIVGYITVGLGARLMSDTKGKDKEKIKTTGKLDIGSSEATSRKEVGVQDSLCVVTAQAPAAMAVGESVTSVLDKLIHAVDGVWRGRLVI